MSSPSQLTHSCFFPVLIGLRSARCRARRHPLYVGLRRDGAARPRAPAGRGGAAGSERQARQQARRRDSGRWRAAHRHHRQVTESRSTRELLRETTCFCCLRFLLLQVLQMEVEVLLVLVLLSLPPPLLASVMFFSSLGTVGCLLPGVVTTPARGTRPWGDAASAAARRSLAPRRARRAGRAPPPGRRRRRARRPRPSRLPVRHPPRCRRPT
jgi:hypothetical protein